MRIGYLAAAVLGAVVLSLTGCGFKTDPVPPGNVVPKAVDDLRYSLDETGVTLSWTYPDETVQGDDLTEISTFDVYRAVVPLADLCETCPIPFSEPTQIPGGETGEAMERFGLSDHASYISTGGGACLALLRGKTMPALEALRA